MQTFKDFVTKDNEVFFNIDEFAETHIIANEHCNIVYTNENNIKSDGRLNDDYVNNESFSFLVKREQIGFKPIIDNLIDFDRKSYIVINVIENFDTYEIFLEVSR